MNKYVIWDLITLGFASCDKSPYHTLIRLSHSMIVRYTLLYHSNCPNRTVQSVISFAKNTYHTAKIFHFALCDKSPYHTLIHLSHTMIVRYTLIQSLRVKLQGLAKVVQPLWKNKFGIGQETPPSTPPQIFPIFTVTRKCSKTEVLGLKSVNLMQAEVSTRPAYILCLGWTLYTSYT